MTKVSVIVPAYNVESFLREALDSVLNQTVPPYEIIVVNDGSTDATEEVALSYGSRIRYIKQDNQGLSGARNTGIRAATGDWISLFDSDDVMAPDKLQKQIAVIEANPNLILVYSGFSFLYPDGSTQQAAFFPAKKLWPALRYRTPILPSTTIIRHSALTEVGNFNQIATEDWDLWFRLIRRYGPASFLDVPESLLLYRQGEHNLSKKYMNMARGMLQMLDTRLLDGLSGLSRVIWRRKIEAKIYYNLAVAMRANKDDRYWAFALESFFLWPFFGRTLPIHRYRVMASMVRRREFRFNFRYWWPVRTCRKDLHY